MLPNLRVGESQAKVNAAEGWVQPHMITSNAFAGPLPTPREGRLPVTTRRILVPVIASQRDTDITAQQQ